MVERKHPILKLSGELFSEGDVNISFPRYDEVSKQILRIREKTGIAMAIVVGAGNIMRGRDADKNVDPNEADSMGMLATIMNGVALRDALVRNGADDTRLMSAVDVPGLAEPYRRMVAKHHLKKGQIIIIGGGLGRPGFSTDSAVAQYARELDSKIIFKASTVDGVYDSDPKKDKSAKRYEVLTYQEALLQQLGVMDNTAFAMCMNTNIPIFVFDIKDLDRLPDAIKGDHSFGTLVHK